ncbi:MAG: hypothetical protein GTO00_09140 [Deltaproteobacteria bacterium]|nr:hypothetical protein [Deltaproteobacteria bacterium]
MSVDLTNSDLKDISIGDVVTVVVKGKVKSLDAGMKPSAEEKEDGFTGFPPDMSIEITSTKVSKSNDFAELAEDD